MALLMLMYSFIKWRNREPYDYPMVKKFMTFLWATFILAFTLEMLELATVIYERGWHWSIVGPLLRGPLFESFVIGQVLILSVISLFLLGYVVLSDIGGKALLYLANIGSLMLVLQVLFMRFNVVIGGQLISKSERGFVDFHWEVFGEEGLLIVALIFTGPFVLYHVIGRFIPIFETGPAKASDEHG
jgi:predicted membrane protein